MRHQNSGKRMGRRSEERLALARNLTAALFSRFGNEREFIFTTVAKAKWVRSFVERSITLGIKGYRELQKAADANGTTIAEMRSQHTTGETKKKLKDFSPKVREHVGRSLHFRRMAAARLRDPHAVKQLFEQIAPRYLERPGGYVRILKTGMSDLGDKAPKAIIGFVEGADAPKAKA
jgi:large subunit ribosomal protein L17